jgi:hypothetical protein
MALAALDHGCMYFFSSVYEYQIAHGYNTFRWVEYSVSASIMNVLIALLCGVLEIQLLLAIFMLTAMCMVFGRLGENTSANTTVIFALGCVPFVTVWALLVTNFFTNVAHADSVPPFVIAIVCLLIVLETLFGVHQHRRSLSYIRKEQGFLILSPLAKLTLAGLTYGGVRSLS